MQWKKLGKIFCANNSNTMASHGRMPATLHIKDDIFRIYFESRNKYNIASPYYLDIDINYPDKILYLETNPLLQFGSIGTFDDNGITPFSVIRNNNEVWMYYVGWNLEVKVMFQNAIGLAISTDEGKTFTKKFEGPIFNRDKYDIFFPTGPLVIKDNDVFKMWYTSFEKWKKLDHEKLKHFYNIKYRESKDGINWIEKPIVSIDFKNEYEYAFVPRGLIKNSTKYAMWYSYRAQKNIDTYRIGYAESKDGINWTRKDEEAGIDISESGWDSEMICYPHVFDHKGKRYMLYNGNGYGKTGFGLAVLERQ